jgi:hemoglobin/transferrin/lactoferrin receptor protein
MMRHSTANNELTGHADINIGWKKWAVLTSFSHNRYSDLRMGANGPDEYLKPFYVQRVDSVDQVVQNQDPRTQVSTGYSQINLMQKIRFTPNEKWDIEYGFHYSETSEYDRYDRLIETTSNGLPRSAVWKYGPQKWMMNNLAITHFGQNKLYDYMTVRLAQQNFEESRIDRRFNHHRLRTQLERVNAYSANIDFEKKTGRHLFFYGAEAVLNDVISNGSAIDITDNSPIPVQDRYPQSTWNTVSGYFNYQFHINEKIVAQTGLRYSSYQINSDFTRHLEFFPFDFTTVEINNGSFNGTLGMTYNPNKKWSLSVNTSTGFRAPNVDDIGKIFDFSAGDIVVPNTDLKSEYAYNAEASISRIFGTFVKVDVTGFYTYLDNAMVRRAFSLNGQDSILYDGDLSKVFAIQNAAYGTVYGFNTNVEFNLSKGFRLSTRLNYQLGIEELEDGTTARSRHAAPWFGLTRFSYSRKLLNLQLYATYSGEVSAENLNPEEQQKEFLYAKNENGELYSPSWYTLNFKAMYQATEKISFSAGIENITDQRYRPYSSGLAAAGRNFILSFMLKF